MRYLITGGAGFIGSALIRSLVKNPKNVVLNIDSLTYAGNTDSLKKVCSLQNYSMSVLDICNQKKIFEILVPS